ncbi:winged helix DNA-binding domain-containing protein [Pseudonocardia phyllosphaerae]|uniref:winged helix DNA-binding domain-containing protein n=1 Tax=Pseudonocardia phyllosphaerae TaxID=3390502 RepID=UPI00397C0683
MPRSATPAPVRHVTDDERRARLVVRHRLAPDGRTDDVVRLADDLVALHSSDPVTVYLSAAARMATPALEPVERALYEDRTLLRHHAMRRTLWVLGHAHAAFAHHGATAGVAAAQLRALLGQLGASGIADPGAWYDEQAARVLDLLTERGPTTAREVGAALPDLAGHRVTIQGGTQPTHTRLLLLLGFTGRVLRGRPTGTWINGQYRWSATEDWLPGGIPDVAPREAAAGLARAYLHAFGPATREDLRWWAGWTVTTTTTALADVGAVPVALDGGSGNTTTGYLLPDDVDPVPDPGPSVALLPGLDPTTMGWKARAFHLSPEAAAQVFDRSGNGGPAIWVDGRVAGSWVQRPDGEIATRLFTDVGAAAEREVAAAAERHRVLLGDACVSVRYPAPIQAELLGSGDIRSGPAPGRGR